ncbi:hypothetical protein PaecuDRAFT_0723 [Paenibacillus curdlanolyticus YK9]|uniref:Uncharacterized protein n=1 Tax=Paenibacillus curdlanolyticus YK9 TaxID=717606 RepID=E0I501_9BACL|nr:hypothetical protein [Paenibacillus curdlanolyticus]EFM12043.1 hypothetical protein PaecuDRAFT_0723 [Paenibacillus curdlanolyticus YK9]
MGYYNLDPNDISELISSFLEKNNKQNLQLDEVTKMFEEYFEMKANETYPQYANNYPPKTLALLHSYHLNREEFLKTFELIHNEEIQNLKSKVTKNKYTISGILRVLLNDETCNDLEVQSIAAICSLNRLHKKIIDYTSTSLFYSDTFEGLINTYGNMLFDAECLGGFSSRRQSRLVSMEIFPLSRQMIEYNFTYQYPVVESAVFLIRQAIEVQIKRGLGILYLKRNKSNGSLADVPITQLIKYIKKEISNKRIALSVDINILELINKWVNSYIHTGIFNYPLWYIEWIQFYLNDFFYVQKAISNLYESSEFNSNASIFAERNYAKKIQENLKRYFKDCDLTPYSKPEIISISRSEIIVIQNEIRNLENRLICKV